MKPDNLEERLQNLPTRGVPDAWRDEILAAARVAAPVRQVATGNRATSAGLTPWWRVWLWPCPEAWAGVAAAWCMILGLHLVVGRSERSLASQSAPPPVPAQVWMAFGEQRRLLAELDLSPHASVRPPPSLVIPRPRSCRQPGTFMA